jgi:hypothetical protein
MTILGVERRCGSRAALSTTARSKVVAAHRKFDPPLCQRPENPWKSDDPEHLGPDGDHSQE